MRIWLHLTLSISLCFVWAIVMFFVLHKIPMNGTLRIIIIGISILIGGLFIQRRFSQIPATCPNCGGPSYYHGGRPITYQCSKCGHIHTTIVSEGKF